MVRTNATSGMEKKDVQMVKLSQNVKAVCTTQNCE